LGGLLHLQLLQRLRRALAMRDRFLEQRLGTVSFLLDVGQRRLDVGELLFELGGTKDVFCRLGVFPGKLGEFNGAGCVSDGVGALHSLEGFAR
jgi:hypothetical protein